MCFCKFLNYSIYYGGSELLLSFLEKNRQISINTINPHSYCVAKKDGLFQKALKASDLLLPDGVGISLAEKLLYGKKVLQYTGPTMHIDILQYANIKKLKVFYLGSNETTLNLIYKRIKNEYPNIKEIYTYSPPFKTEFTKEDNIAMVNVINQTQPDILFIGMTAPKQEKWGYLFREKLHVKVICSIGAAFDFFAGTVPLAPAWMIHNHLQWLYRLYKEPVRMWKRNFISTPVFLFDMFMYKCGLKKM